MNSPSRPQITAIAAMSADGKIADFRGSPARFGSSQDKKHLETQIAALDGVIFGANTLRAYGTSLSIRDPQLLAERQRLQKPPQPWQFVCSASGKITQDLRFFSQPFPRGLITTPTGAEAWRDTDQFEVIYTLDETNDWRSPLEKFVAMGIKKLGILGGGELIASFAAQHLLDELWLTICPILLGGKTAPTVMGGMGFLEAEGLTLKLISTEVIESEIFVHYRVVH